MYSTEEHANIGFFEINDGIDPFSGPVVCNDQLVRYFLGPKDHYASEERFRIARADVKRMLRESVLPKELWIDKQHREVCLNELISNGEIHVSSRFAHYGCDSTFVGRINSRVLRNDNRVQGWVDDISDQMELLEEAQQTRFHVDRALHDMRNLLMPVGNYARFLLEDNISEEQREDVQQIIDAYERSVARLNNVMEDLRGKRTYERAFIGANYFVDAMKDRYTNLFRKEGVDLFTRGRSQSLVCVDQTKIEDVFVNLVKNARESFGNHTGLITFSCIDEDDCVVYEVKDTGCGISAVHLPIIFEPYATFGKENGTGLGLYSCREIVCAHDGEIHCVSEVDEGTTFTVRLPQAQKDL